MRDKGDGRRRWSPLRLLILIPAVPAIVALGVVAMAPLSWAEAAPFAEPGRVIAPADPPLGSATPTSQMSPLAPVVAPSPTTAAKKKAYAPVNFAKPDVDIVPPPPPPTYGGGGGGCSYKGVAGQSGKAFLAKINNARSANGVAPLSWSSSLGCTAMRYSAKMAYTDSKNGGGPGNALKHNPNRPSGGENVAMFGTTGSMSRSAAITKHHELYMNSPAHRKNVLNPKWRRVGAGIAVVKIDGSWTVWYSTENFQ